MSTEHKHTRRIPFEPIRLCFKRLKVAISNAIKRPFPFLELLRDNNLITGKMYDDFQDSCTNLVPIQKVVYRALEELEKRLDPDVLWLLFRKETMEAYPDLELISKSFQTVLPQNELHSEEIDRGDLNSQLSLKQGPGDSCSQESLTWSPSGPSSSDGWRSNDGENATLTQGSQTETHQFFIPQIHNVVSLPENGLSEDLCEIVHVKEDTTGDDIDGLQRPQAATPQGPGSEPLESRELEVQPSGRDARLEPHIPLPCSKERAEILSHGIKICPCSVNLVDIKQENSSVFLSGEQQAHARTDHNQASEVIVLTSKDSDDGNSCLEESTSVICQSKPVNSRNPPTSGNIHGKRDMSDTQSSSTRKRQRRTSPRDPRQSNVDFNCPELPVTCGSANGTLYVEKLKRGTHEKSIQNESGEWFTPREFEIKGNRQNFKNWKKSIRCYERTLEELIKNKLLPESQMKRGQKKNPPNPQ